MKLVAFEKKNKISLIKIDDNFDIKNLQSDNYVIVNYNKIHPKFDDKFDDEKDEIFKARKAKYDLIKQEISVEENKLNQFLAKYGKKIESFNNLKLIEF